MGLLDRIRRSGAPSTSEDADRLALRQLAARGADLARSRHIVHVLSAADGSSARRAAAAAERSGYRATVEGPDRDGVWTVRAEGMRVVDATTVGAFRSAFERLAEASGTTYEGWEAAPKP